MTVTETLVERRRRQARERKRKQRARERKQRERGELPPARAAGVDSAAELASLGRSAAGLQDALGEIAIADLKLAGELADLLEIAIRPKSFAERFRVAEAGVRRIVEGVHLRREGLPATAAARFMGRNPTEAEIAAALEAES